MIERWVDEKGLDFRGEDGLQPPPPIPWTILLQQSCPITRIDAAKGEWAL
jgi:hypothetical protein